MKGILLNIESFRICLQLNPVLYFSAYVHEPKLYFVCLLIEYGSCLYILPLFFLLYFQFWQHIIDVYFLGLRPLFLRSSMKLNMPKVSLALKFQRENYLRIVSHLSKIAFHYIFSLCNVSNLQYACLYLRIHSVYVFSFLLVCIFLGCLSFHVRRHFCAFHTLPSGCDKAQMQLVFFTRY